MKTRIAYVLTSNYNDIYYEQALLSIISLRKHNQDAHVVLIVDEKTNNTLTESRKEIERYISEKIVVKVPDEYTQAQASRYLKTSLMKYIKGDFLFIDCDTLIVDSLDNIDTYFQNKRCLMMVPDRHLPLKHFRSDIIKKIKHEIEQNGLNLPDIGDYYFNTGIMLVKDTESTRKFFDMWHNTWKQQIKTGLFVDQPPLAITNAKNGYIISELDGIWNCQIASNALQYIHKAKIIHCFSTNISEFRHPYYFLNKEPYIRIKDAKSVPEDILLLAENAKSTFAPVNEIITDNDIEFFHSDLHTVYIYHKKYFNLIKFFITIPFKLKNLFGMK